MNIINKLNNIKINKEIAYGWNDCSFTIMNLDEYTLNKIINISKKGEPFDIIFLECNFRRQEIKKDIKITIKNLIGIRKQNIKEKYIFFCEYLVNNKNINEFSCGELNKEIRNYKSYNEDDTYPSIYFNENLWDKF